MIMAEMNSAWVSLSDSRARNLKGYGQVNPQLEGLIDPEINKLAQIALELARIFQ